MHTPRSPTSVSQHVGIETNRLSGDMYFHAEETSSNEKVFARGLFGGWIAEKNCAQPVIQTIA